jgi:polyisoprenoid-binding protein YceI
MRKFTALALAAASLTLMTPLAAQNEVPPIPGKLDAARVTAGTYAADPSHSLVGFRVNHFGFNDYFGIFGDVAGTLEIDPANLAAAKVDVTIPLSGLTTASAKLTGHMNGTDFFETEKYPAARFVSTKVTVEGMSATIEGNLTIKDVTLPVTLDAEFTGAGSNPFTKKETIGFEASTAIKRSDFGIKYGVPIVSDEVRLGITAAFEKG